MSHSKIGHRVSDTPKAAPAKPVEKPNPAPAASAEHGHSDSPKDKVALSAPETESGRDQSAHVDAIKENFSAKNDAKPGEKDPQAEQAKDDEQVKDGDKTKDGEKTKTPEQQRAALNEDIKDIQQELKDATDPAEKKALEEELARLQGELKGLEPKDQPEADGATGSAGGVDAVQGGGRGAAAAGGAAPAGGGRANQGHSPWQSEQQSSEGGPSEGGPSEAGAASGPPPDANPSGNVKEWVAQAMQILQQEGVDMSKVREQDIYLMIKKESGGDPKAQNNWDSNAKKGTPSKGIMQCIDSTFNQYKSPGHGDIWNPVDNIVAAVKYAVKRYGSTANVPGVKSTAEGGAYKGY